MVKTKKEWIKWFLSLDDDVEIEIRSIAWETTHQNGKLTKVTISA